MAIVRGSAGCVETSFVLSAASGGKSDCWTKKLVVFNLPPGFALNMHTADSAPTQADTERTLRVVD